MEITRELIKTKFSYDPETGLFYSLKLRRTIGSISDQGYVRINIFPGVIWFAHRLAFLYMKGETPKYVDHINRNRADNRWLNLRESSSGLNHANGKWKNKNGKKGVVSRLQADGTMSYRAKIKHKGIWANLGTFQTLEEAAEAYRLAAVKLWGDNICIETKG